MITVGKVNNADDFAQFIKELCVKGPVSIVKPNWNNANSYTSAKRLHWLFSALKGRTKIIDGYSLYRNELNTGPERREPFNPTKAKARWKWIKEQDEWFLKFSGIDKVLSKYSVEYINITEDVWSMKTLDPGEVRDFVDTKYGILMSQEMYSFVPIRISELRGSTLLSITSSNKGNQRLLSTENLYSLIPNPARHIKWYGKGGSRLSQSIVDINKIYRSFFSPCYWINEIEGMGLFVGSKNSLEADAVAARLLNINPEKIEYFRHVVNVFGGYDEKLTANLPKLQKLLKAL